MKKKTSVKKILSLTRMQITALDKVTGQGRGAFNHSRLGPGAPSMCRYCQV